MNRRPSEPEDTGEAPIVIHRPAGTGGRRVIRAQVAGLARSDNDVIEFLRRAGLPDAGDVLDAPQWVQWQGGSPHEYGAPSPKWPRR